MIFDLWGTIAEKQEGERQGLADALGQVRAEIARDRRNIELYLAASDYLRRLKDDDQALKMIREAISRCDPKPKLYRAYIRCLERSNLTGEAIAVAAQAERLFPGNLYFRMREALLLPVLYSSLDELVIYRKRYSDGLDRLLAELDLSTESARRDAVSAIGHHDNYYIGYVCENPRDLMERYASLVTHIMHASYPQWTAPLEMPARELDGRLRVGYVSGTICTGCSVMKTHLGWLRERDRSRASVAVYNLRPVEDQMSTEVKALSDAYHFVPNLVEACRQILTDRPHVLVYLDVGVRPITAQMASLRLAPVQCAAWDPTFTTGFHSVDYYLSAEFNETADAQNHYTEKLVTLPGIGVCYKKPEAPWLLLTKTRRDFGLRENSIIYACNQAIFKYMPQEDEVFAKIARRVGNSQFVFLVSNPVVKRDLTLRLQRAFSREALNAMDYCVILPECDWLSWLNLNRISDVFLDTLEWSGGITSFEAAACGIPIVTLPGRYMRGRQSLGILRKLGLMETVARDMDDYVEIAVRLGQDQRFRKEIARRMVDGHTRLYDDREGVRALEDFMDGVIAARLSI